MPLPFHNDEGFVISTLAIAVLSLVLGAGAAYAAVSTVVTSYGSDDKVAVQTGAKDVLAPESIISYGG